jgi:hypothetical protein
MSVHFKRLLVTFAAQSCLWTCLIAALLLLFIACRPCWAQSPSPQGQSPTQTHRAPTDVVVLIVPIDATTARVAVAYHRKLPHDAVRKELARLEAAGAGRIANDVVMTDQSVHADDVKKYPVTTAAMFTLRNTTPVANNAPVLAPYLRAFQAWNHIEVMFALPELIPYRGVEKFDSDALTVQLQRGQGVYRYEATIRDHSGELPALTVAPAKGAGETAGTTEAESKEASGNSAWSGLLILSGVGLIVCVSAYILVARRTVRGSAARPVR